MEIKGADVLMFQLLDWSYGRLGFLLAAGVPEVMGDSLEFDYANVPAIQAILMSLPVCHLTV